MGLFDALFGKRPKPVGRLEGKYKLLTGYEPVFSRFGGGIYESQLIRSSINARATHISKLAVEIAGTAKPALRNKLKHGPNMFQTWGQFLYRLSTILDVHNTAFIVPVWDEYGEISGIYAPLPNRVTLKQFKGVPYLSYEFSDGNKAAVELEFCGVMTKFQYADDIRGETNRALTPTLDLISIQDQGIKEGVKSAASYRFMARLSNFTTASDLAKERKEFSALNFAADAEGGGLLLFPNKYTDIQQVTAKPFVMDADTAKATKESVYQYFGVNEDVLENKAFGDSWAAFYEGAIEPFAIQFSDVMTKMLFTFREQTNGNRVTATSNRLQYLSNQDKLNVSSQLLDRGIMSINDVRQIWNLPEVEGGDRRIIRGEYYDADAKLEEQNGNGQEGNQDV